MKIITFKIVGSFLLAMGITALHAQEVITSAGGNASGSGGTVEYTVGQLVFTTNSGNGGTVYQGVQQAYEIYVISGIDPLQKINPECSVYPNPSTNYLTLSIKDNFQGSLTALIYTLNGNLVESINIKNNKTQIDISRYVPDIYFLMVLNNQKEVRTFKIIKN